MKQLVLLFVILISILPFSLGIEATSSSYQIDMYFSSGSIVDTDLNSINVTSGIGQTVIGNESISNLEPKFGVFYMTENSTYTPLVVIPDEILPIWGSFTSPKIEDLPIALATDVEEIPPSRFGYFYGIGFILLLAVIFGISVMNIGMDEKITNKSFLHNPKLDLELWKFNRKNK